MIINKKTKEFQTRSDKPNENWLNDDHNYYVVDDGSYLANKIIDNYPYIDLIVDNNVIVDIIINENAKQLNAQIEAIKKEINALKQKLTDTDYKALKYVEGQISEEEYAPIKAERQAWRDEINELELKLAKEGE